MRRIIYLVFIFVVLFISSNSPTFASPDPIPLSGGNPYDSLLFDGTGNQSSLESNARLCKVIVKYVTGDADGSVEHTLIEDICSQPDTGMIVKAEKLKSGDTLHIGDSIHVGPDAYVQILYPDGSETRIGPNSGLTIAQDMCEKFTLSFRWGKFWTSIKHALGGAKYEVRTQRAVIGNRGTVFSVEMYPDQEIVKCYDGGVDVKINKVDWDKGAAMKQLTKDFQDGKITAAELAQKINELNVSNTKINTTVAVDAGNMCSVSGMLSDPAPIDPATDDRWYETNFK